MTDSSDFFIGMAQQTLWITALAAAPILVPALLGGLLLGMISGGNIDQRSDIEFCSQAVGRGYHARHFRWFNHVSDRRFYARYL